MDLDRRDFLAACSRAGVMSGLFPGVLYTLALQAQQEGKTDQSKPPKITHEMIDQAAIIAGVGPFADKQKSMMIAALVDQEGSYKAIRSLKLANSVAPAFVFHPLRPAGEPIAALKPGVPVDRSQPDTPGPGRSRSWTVADAPSDLEDLAFASVRELSGLLSARKITSLALTQMYIARLRRYDPKLHFVINLTEERAIAQAKAADREIAAGRHRSALLGIPWGAKDLLAVKGYPTTWGAGGFEHQFLDDDATVVKRLDAAGAVLIAKLSLGALAMGDKWFGGQTRNPWNPRQGSSGSSAGPASAVAAGCVPFALGSETLGSISSPSTRCGATGLRPSFGFVPRTGAMALSWTMDKLGPLARSAEDCALVLSVIHGPDGQDGSASPASFHWNPDLDIGSLRIGYLRSDFEQPAPFKAAPPSDSETDEQRKERERRSFRRAQHEYDRRFDQAALQKLRAMGIKLIPVDLPKLPYGAMIPLLTAEAAAAFDELTMSGTDRLLTEQGVDDWPNAFRVSRFYPAVEYIQANRARSLAIEQVSALFEKVDILVAASGGPQLLATNLTGHPALIVPNGLRGDDAPRPTEDGDEGSIGGPGTPVSITFLAGLYDDARLAAFGQAYQAATGFHKLHPKLD